MLRKLTLTIALLLVVVSAMGQAANAKLSPRTVNFWVAVAQCEQPGSGWRGVYWNHPGPTFQGGLGFYFGTWDAWSSELHPGGKSVHDRYPDMGMAPPLVQIWVADYGLKKYGAWGCVYKFLGR